MSQVFATKHEGDEEYNNKISKFCDVFIMLLWFCVYAKVNSIIEVYLFHQVYLL